MKLNRPLVCRVSQEEVKPIKRSSISPFSALIQLQLQLLHIAGSKIQALVQFQLINPNNKIILVDYKFRPMPITSRVYEHGRI